jgi:hypothetical protein
MYAGPDDAPVTMNLDFAEGTPAADAAPAMAEVGRRVRERFPMIKRLFIESGSPALPQRWSRPDAIRTQPDAWQRSDLLRKHRLQAVNLCPTSNLLRRASLVLHRIHALLRINGANSVKSNAYGHNLS